MVQDLGLVKPHMMIPEVTQLLLSVQVRSFTRFIDLFDIRGIMDFIHMEFFYHNL